MLLTKTAISRPIFILMFVLALVVLGIQSRSRMPAELFPKIDFPYVTVVTAYPGAGPNEIETQVSEKIEKAVSSIGGLKNVTSASQDGVSVVGIEFELGTDINAVAADVRDKVSAIKRDLPKDIEEPSIIKADISSMSVLTIGLEGPISGKEMRILADDTIQDQLSKVSGVASVNINGGDEREISVSVDKNRLDAYGIGISDVIYAIQGTNLNLPAGSIKEGPRDWSVRTVGEFKSADELANVQINIPGKNGKPDTNVRLQDVAKIHDTVAEPDVLARMNGKSTVTISLQKQSDANTVEVCDGVKRELEKLKAQFPKGVKAIIAEDQSKNVKDSLNDVNKSLYEGIILVVLIVFLFLHSARATFIVACAIPTSLMATYTPIFSLGYTLNFMTLLALSLVVGILVDDSIVVLENIERHVRMREKPEDAALNGRTEIGFAAIAITLVDIVVFVPIAFMGGIVGQFFRQFGITVAVATMFSLLTSFTLTPMLASRWLKSREDKEKDDAALQYRLQNRKAGLFDRVNAVFGKVFAFWERAFSFIEVQYRRLLEWAIGNRFLVITIGTVTLFVVLIMTIPLPKTMDLKAWIPRLAVALIAVIMCLFSMWKSRSKHVALGFTAIMLVLIFTIYIPLGIEFEPNRDDGTFAITVRTPPGSSLIKTDSIVRQVEKVLDSIPEMKGGFYITTVGKTSAGGLGAGDSGSQYSSISCKALAKSERKPDPKLGRVRRIDEIAEEVSRKTSDIAGAELISITVGEGGGPGGGVTLEVQGTDLSQILKTAEQVAKIVEKTPGAIDVDISYKEGRPERRIIVDREKAAELGLSTSQIAMAVRYALDGDDSAKLREAGTEYPINVRYELNERNKSSDIETMIVGHKDGTPVYLKDVAEVRYDFAPTKIDRKNRQKVVSVTANLAKGALLGNVQREIMASLQKIPSAPGVQINPGGSGEIMNESFGYMGSALIMAILFVYMLMGALFESFLTPFVIMFSLPQAMIGALLALIATGKSMSIVSMIGIIMLMGLVAKNAILMVDFTNTLRNRGKNRTEAILTAGPIRLKPILMTTLAMVGGMMPTAIALNEGSEIRQPMAIAVIGGLIFSMLLTLIVIPVVYTIVDDLWNGLLRRFFPNAYRRAQEKHQNIVDQYEESIKHKGEEWVED